MIWRDILSRGRWGDILSRDWDAKFGSDLMSQPDLKMIKNYK
jgi:hypothetical protein